MERSRTQVLYRHLPKSVYHHEDGPIIRTVRVEGPSLDSQINLAVLYEELDAQLRRWPPDQLVNLVLPSAAGERAFEVVLPETVYYDVWPLVLKCRGSCGRVRRFFEPQQLTGQTHADGKLRCASCGGPMRQLRYYSCHQCGKATELFTPRCDDCNGYDHVYFVDTGSFITSYWRCLRHGFLQKTRQSPCSCGRFARADATQPFMRSFTTRDPRTYYPQTVSFLNPKSLTYDNFQKHPSRGRIALASLVGEVQSLEYAMQALAGGSDGSRMTEEEWSEALRTKYAGLDEADIDAIRRIRGPVTDGPLSVAAPTGPLAELATSRRVLERAALFDPELLERRSLVEAREHADRNGRTLMAAKLRAAKDAATRLGIADIAVCTEFPVALAAYGYTRIRREPGEASVTGFQVRSTTGGSSRYRIFALPAETEALVVSLSAVSVLTWLEATHNWTGSVPSSEKEARLKVVELFAEADDLAGRVRTLTHSISHALLRSLADGRSGFGEASMAEWVSPETLTCAVYVASLHSESLGALWTVLHHGCEEWLQGAIDAVWSCQNDPLCHLRESRACERCLFVTFGCPVFNEDLSRTDPMSFWRLTGATPQ